VTAAKEAAADAISREVQDGDHIAIGAGTTVNRAIEAIGRRIRRESIAVSAVVASHETAARCQNAGIAVTYGLSDRVEWGFDGADEVDPNLDLLKGSHGKMLRERLLASIVKRYVILAEERKLVESLGQMVPIPIEVVPQAVPLVCDQLKNLGAAEMAVREIGSTESYVLTEMGNLIVNVRFGTELPSHERLKALPGVVETGIFANLCNEVIVGDDRGVVRRLTSERRGK
jgi:ribose 5-phosphate isomerase A